MTNVDLAMGLRAQAEDRLRVARIMLDSKNFAYCVRSCQEAVELALKALLLRAGIDPPKWHDVGRIVRDHRYRWPGMSDEEVDETCFISTKLRADRERSMYGDEDMSVPPQDLDVRHDAEVSMTWTRRVMEIVDRHFGEADAGSDGDRSPPEEPH